MIYLKHSTTGEVFAFDSEQDVQSFAPAGVVPMTEQEVQEHLNPPAPPVGVPSVVTMRQARLALLGAGLLAQVDAAIDALPSPQKEAARIEWEYSQEVHRDRPFVALLGAAMGLSEQQLDDLFTVAATL